MTQGFERAKIRQDLQYSAYWHSSNVPHETRQYQSIQRAFQRRTSGKPDRF